MKKNEGIAIENSFTLKFENTTNSVRAITLFEQGGNDLTDVIEVNSASENASQGNITQPLTIWNFASSQPYQYPSNPITSLVNVDNFRPTSSGILEVISDNGSSKVDVTISTSDSLNDVNTKINNAIRNTATLNNFKSPSGKFAEINVFFDLNYFERFSLPQSLTGSVYRNSWGISVQYPSDLTSQKLQP